MRLTFEPTECMPGQTEVVPIEKPKDGQSQIVGRSTGNQNNCKNLLINSKQFFAFFFFFEK